MSRRGRKDAEGLKRGVRSFLVAAGLASAVLSTGAVLSFYEESLPGTLNPLYAQSMVDFRSQELVFDRIYFHSPIDNRIMSRVVEKGELAEGGKAYKLTLKAGLKWHDGKPVTSKDVCFTVNAMLDPKTPSPMAAGYRTVLAGCEAQAPTVALVRFTKVFHNPPGAPRVPAAPRGPVPGEHGDLAGPRLLGAPDRLRRLQGQQGPPRRHVRGVPERAPRRDHRAALPPGGRRSRRPGGHAPQQRRPGHRGGPAAAPRRRERQR